VAAGDWNWDETLYAGSAAHYAIGRMPYPAAVADVIRDELSLDGRGRLLDRVGPSACDHAQRRAGGGPTSAPASTVGPDR
jgi:hypothetical protein